MTDGEERDPFAPIQASPAFRRPMAIAAFVLAIVALFEPFVSPVVGMGLGLMSHVKGDRLGFPATIAAAVGAVVGMSLFFFTR